MAKKGFKLAWPIRIVILLAGLCQFLTAAAIYFLIKDDPEKKEYAIFFRRGAELGLVLFLVVLIVYLVTTFA